MTRALGFWSILLAVPFFFFTHTTQAAFVVPEATGHIVDTADMLTQDSVFEEQLAELKTGSGIELAVVTIPTLNNEITLEEAAAKIFNTWGIGNKEKDNGALLLIIRDDRLTRIEVGYGAEGALTDLTSKQILEGMKPYFRAGNFDEGVQYALGEMLYTLNSDPSLRVDSSSSESSNNNDSNLDIILFLLFNFGGIGFIWGSSVLARSKSWHAGGIVGGVFGLIGLLFFSFPWILIPVLAAAGAFWDYLVSSEYKSKGNDSSWWAGGSGGGWSSGSGSSSGGGFGGFGGGSSGGGGASSGW